jgi:hypothetical protein
MINHDTDLKPLDQLILDSTRGDRHAQLQLENNHICRPPMSSYQRMMYDRGYGIVEDKETARGWLKCEL